MLKVIRIVKHGNGQMWFIFQMDALTDGWRIDWGGGQQYDEREKLRRPLITVLVKDYRGLHQMATGRKGGQFLGI